MTAVRAALITLALALLAACGQQTPASLTVELDTNTVELLRGAPETQVQVTLTRTGGATGDVELSLTGLAAEVSASFSPAVLSGDTHTSTLTLSATAAAIEDRHTLDLTATAPGLTANASLEIEVVGLTVTGTVMGYVSGPLAGVTLASQDDTAVTDAAGRFTLRGLSLPYDVTVWSVAESWLHRFEGLTESDVLLSVSAPTGAPTRTTSVDGTLAGDAIPVGANQIVMACLEGFTGLVQICDVVDPTESNFTINPSWNGSATRSARLHLLQIERDGADKPIDYLGYASLDLEIQDGVPLVLPEAVDLGDPLETISVDVEVDTTLTPSQIVAAVQVGPALSIMVMIAHSNDKSHEVLMPVIPGMSYAFVSMSSALETGWTVGVTGTDATVVVLERPTITAPAPDATDVTLDTSFSISDPAGRAATWIWTGAGLSLGLTSDASSVNLPDPSEYGLSIPPSAGMNVQVLSSGGSGTEAAARSLTDYVGSVLIGIAGASLGYTADGSFAMSDLQSFTTAP